MIIVFSHISTSLATRHKAAEIRGQIVDAISSNKFVVFDFENVNVITNSFADECFGKLLDSFTLEVIKTNSTFKNVSPFVSKVIASTIRERSALAS